jgi:hypothetical protein
MKEFKQMEKVQVMDGDGDTWREAIFVCVDPTGSDYPYVARCRGDKWTSAWKHCQRPKPNLKVDDPVWVREDCQEEWNKRHFASWKGDKILCWSYGRTSFTTTESTSWTTWSTEKPEEE